MPITQISARNSCWLDGITVAAQDIRLDHVSAGLTSTGASGTTGIAATAGVRNAVGAPLACVWQSGMGFNLNAGMCFVQGTSSATAGVYGLVLDTTTLLTVTTSDPTNPRIDSVAAVVVDNGDNTSTFVFKILSGTPAPGPVAPTLPANALLLCNIAVSASVSVLSSGNFTDKRVFTVASGGILPYANTTGATINGPAGSYVDDLATGRLKRLDGSGNARAAKVAAFAAVTQTLTSPVAIPAGGGGQTIATASFTTDGATEVRIDAFMPGWFQSPTPVVGAQIQTLFTLDGSVSYPIPAFYWRQDSATLTTASGGGTLTAYLTPAAGSHTITWQAQVAGNNSQPVSLYCNGNYCAYLRVSAVLA